MPNQKLLLPAAILISAAALTAAQLAPRTLAADDKPGRPAGHHIAYCDLWALANDLARSEKYKETDDRYEREYDTVLKPIYEELEKLSEQLSAIGDAPENDEARKLRDRYVELSREYDEKYKKINNERRLEFAKRLKECVREIRDTAQRIADEEGFVYVLQSYIDDPRSEPGYKDEADAKPDDENADEHADDDRDPWNSVYYTERFRAAIVAPDDANIDPLIRERLKLKPIEKSK